MGDDWRLEVGLFEKGRAHALTERLDAGKLGDDLEKEFDKRLVVSADPPDVFVYAGDRAQAEAAERQIRSVAAEHGWDIEIELKHWHPTAEEWEDPDLPLPSGDAAKKAEHEEMIAAERRQTGKSGHPEYEVRVDLPSFHEASRFADTLRSEDLPVVHRWRFLLIGVPDEDSGKELVERIQEQAPPGSRVNLEGTWAAAYAERPPNPFAVFGGLGG